MFSLLEAQKRSFDADIFEVFELLMSFVTVGSVPPGEGRKKVNRLTAFQPSRRLKYPLNAVMDVPSFLFEIERRTKFTSGQSRLRHLLLSLSEFLQINKNLHTKREVGGRHTCC